MKPNIFDIATKELNQDAFITWILQYADKKYSASDTVLNECGKMFITELIKKQLPDFNEEIEVVHAGRQWENIDVWAEINNKYLIIIEDKTHSSHHSDQLRRYKAIAEKWCSENNYLTPICIYLKTGNESQSSLNNILKAGFATYNRVDFLSLLDKFKENDNDIFNDFFRRLLRIEESNHAYSEKFIDKWNGNDWQGFFQFLEKEMDIVNWHYVNNPGGGFWNAILNWKSWGIYPAYIQLEQGKLCFKISTHPEDTGILDENISRGKVRDKLHRLIISKSKELGFPHIRKPNRFGNGKYMTVAVVDRENWLGVNDSLIDKKTVIEVLGSYKEFLADIMENDMKA